MLQKYKDHFVVAVRWMIFVIASIAFVTVGALLAGFVFLTDYGASGVIAIAIF